MSVLSQILGNSSFRGKHVSQEQAAAQKRSLEIDEKEAAVRVAVQSLRDEMGIRAEELSDGSFSRMQEIIQGNGEWVVCTTKLKGERLFVTLRQNVTLGTISGGSFFLRGIGQHMFSGWVGKIDFVMKQPLFDDRLRHIFIHDFIIANREERGKGYGKLLLSALVTYAKKVDVFDVYGFLSDTDEYDSENAMRRNHVYTKLGFAINNRRVTLDIKNLTYANDRACVEARASLDDWGLDKIYRHRFDADCDFNREQVSRSLDAVVLGLDSFLADSTNFVKDCVRKSIPVRILTMNPDNPYINQVAIEKGVGETNLKDSLKELIVWADEINGKSYTKLKIEVKAYDCLPLDFYWRIDDELYVGSHLHGISGNSAITYKFIRGKSGFGYYESYFEQLWNDPSFVALTK